MSARNLAPRMMVLPAAAAVGWNPRGPSCDEHDLATLEFVLGTRLPLGYRMFLLAINGGIPQPRGLVRPDGVEDAVRCLYSVSAPLALVDLRQRTNALRGIVPAGHIPIGAVETGGLLTMRVADLDRDGAYYQPQSPAYLGAIYYLSLIPPRPMRPLVPDYLAASFAQFLSALRPTADDRPPS